MMLYMEQITVVSDSFELMIRVAYFYHEINCGAASLWKGSAKSLVSNK